MDLVFIFSFLLPLTAAWTTWRRVRLAGWYMYRMYANVFISKTELAEFSGLLSENVQLTNRLAELEKSPKNTQAIDLRTVQEIVTINKRLSAQIGNLQIHLEELYAQKTPSISIKNSNDKPTNLKVG